MSSGNRSLFRDLPQLSGKKCPVLSPPVPLVVNCGVAGAEPKLEAIPVWVQFLQTPPQWASGPLPLWER